MQLTIDSTIKNNFDTHLYDILNDVPENIFYNGEHNLRKPYRIYAISVDRVLSAFETFIKTLINNYDHEFEQINWPEIDKNHKELLESLMAFIDDGYHIMKCFYPKSRVKKDEVFADRWLYLADSSIIRNYKRNISPYREKLALIDNAKKHNHARYQHIECKYTYSKSLGYYIEEIYEGKICMPNKNIHPQYNNMCTGISYNKDIRNLLVIFYVIAYFTSNTVKKIISKNHNLNLSIKHISSSRDERILKIFEMIGSISETFLPNEYNNDLPQIIIQNKIIKLKRHSTQKYRDTLLRHGRPLFTVSSTLEDGAGVKPVYT